MELQTYRLKNNSGTEIDFINFGGIVTHLRTPDRNGNVADIVLGFEDTHEYLKHNPSYFNALIGRFANRIAGAQFAIGDKTYPLAKNDGVNSLHGGIKGFDKVFWNVKEIVPAKEYQLSYLSRDGEEGYPGNLTVEVRFSLNDKNEFKIAYSARTDQATHINLTHHCYFNLSGTPGTTALDHVLMIDSDQITESNSNYIPNGNLLEVDKLSDFRKAHAVGDFIDKVHEGYNFNYVLNKKSEVVATLMHPASGRLMEVLTTEPGLQLYSGYFLDTGITGKSKVKYPKFAGLCLEAQHFPDSPNQKTFPSTLLRPGETYKQTTVYRFSCSPAL